MTRLRRGLWLCAVLLAGLAPAAGAEAARSVEYLYIEANEGGSSGGHVALRLGAEVFHFEHRSPGLLVLGQDGFEHFRHRYSVLENRTIHVSRIPVSEETYDLLVGRFRRRLFLQSRHLAAIESLRDDRVTLEQLLSGGIAIEAAGFFFPPRDPPGAPAVLGENASLADLRARVEAVYGADFLDRRTGMLRAGLAGLDPRALELPEPAAVADRLPAPVYGFPQRYRDLTTALAALEALRDARPLVAGAVMQGAPDSLAFTAGDAEAARLLSEGLSSALVRLVASKRPDWGAALMIGMARLAALGESQRTERWVVLDAFPADAGSAARRSSTSRPELAASLLQDAGEELARARERLVTRAADGTFHEADFAAFEAAVNRSGELGLALREGREWRVLRGPLVPSRPARMAIERLDAQALRESLETVRAREEAYAVAFKHRWGYHLVTRNCVSEIFSEIDAAFERGPEESATRLGGRLEMDGSLNFIPAVSAAAVAGAYPVTEQLELPSYRRRRLERMYEQESPLTVFLRESNTLTSTIYRRNAEDSIFVFFTDNAVVARPLFGAVNLVVGLAAGAVGLATLPVDGGATLWAGLKGALFSLPELFFQNIRKGSFEPVGWDRRPGPPALPREAPDGG